MNGLTFNGKHSFIDMGLVMFSKNRPIFPEPKIITEDIPGMDGDYDYSSINPDGRVKYKSMTDEIEFSFAEKNMVNVRAKAHLIAAWLACGEAQLIYDDDPNVYYLAMVVNKLDLENQIARLRKFTMQFKRRPFAYAITEIIITQVVNAATDIIVANPGTYNKPKIHISGTCTTLSVTIGSTTLNCSQALSNAVLDIDCQQMQAIKDSTINVNNKISGKYPELAPGNNSVHIGGTGLNCTVTVAFRPQYL
jgi:predicted phage tail component-like protein